MTSKVVVIELFSVATTVIVEVPVVNVPCNSYSVISLVVSSSYPPLTTIYCFKSSNGVEVVIVTSSGIFTTACTEVNVGVVVGGTSGGVSGGTVGFSKASILVYNSTTFSFKVVIVFSKACSCATFSFKVAIVFSNSATLFILSICS